jgi:hypothetical protein
MPCNSFDFDWKGKLNNPANVLVRLVGGVKPLLEMDNGEGGEGERIIHKMFEDHLKVIYKD